MEKRGKKPMGKPRQIRLPGDIQEDLQEIADANGLEWVDAARMAMRVGLPLLKKRMGTALKQAA